MIPRYTQEEYEQTKVADKLNCECEFCHEIFGKEKRDIKRALSNLPQHQNRAKYCSKKCCGAAKAQIGNIVFNCEYCGTPKKQNTSNYQRSVHHYCSHKCKRLAMIIDIKCDQCGVDITLVKSRINQTNKHFCSKKCAIANQTTSAVVKCFQCGTEITKCQSKIRNTQHLFCSLKCFYTYNNKQQIVKCAQCGKEVHRSLNHIKNNTNTFCSKSCRGIYMAAHKTYGYRRSKLELWVETQLQLLYPNLKILYNNRDAIKYELDVYIPELHLAFEINGIFHYEPIYGTESLSKIQANDIKKFKLCAENNIGLCVINTHRRNYEKHNMEYLGVIVDIIDKNLRHYQHLVDKP